MGKYVFNPFTGKLDYIGDSSTGNYVEYTTAGAFKYVSPTGDDNNNGDTVGTPYLTPQKAVDEICKRYKGDKTVYFADGTYNITDTIRIPSDLEGRLFLLGDLADRSNVVIDAGANFITIIGHGGDLSVLGGQQVLQNGGEVIVDGMTLDNGLFSFWGDGGKITIGSLEMNPVGFGIVCSGVGKVFFKEVAVASTITSSGGLGGFLLANQGSVINYQSLTFNNVEYGIRMDDSSKIESVDGITLTVNLADVENATGIYVGQGSEININSSLAITGNPARTDGRGVDLSASNGIIDVFGSSWDFEDLAVGINLADNSYFDGGEGVFNYTNVIKDVVVDSTSSFKHDNNLDTNPIFENAANLTDGRDVRAFYFNRYY